MARRGHVPHQECSAFFQGCSDVIEKLRRFRLVVNGVEGHDEIESPGVRERRYVLDLETHVREAPLERFGPGCVDLLRDEVVPDEPAAWKRDGDDIERPPAAAADLQDVDSGRERLDLWAGALVLTGMVVLL